MIEVPLLCEIMGQSSLLNPLLSYTTEIFFSSGEYRQNKDKSLVNRDFVLTCKLLVDKEVAVFNLKKI